MSEMDKLVNRAFPDELRNVEPIDVDEDAILALTLEKLGLDMDQADELMDADEPVKTVWVKKSSKPKKEEKLVEVPVVVLKHQWLNWAGWAVAACLMVAFVAKWGPWLITNLGFGTGQPKSAGETTSGYVDSYVQDRPAELDNIVIPPAAVSPEPEPPTVTPEPDNAMILGEASQVTVMLDDVSYGENYETITLTLRFQSTEELNVDEFDLKLESKDYVSYQDLERVRRSNEGDQVTLTYKFKDVSYLPSTLQLTVNQQVPMLDSSGEEVGFGYKRVERMHLDLNAGYASSSYSTGLFYFDSILTASASPEDGNSVE